MYSLRNSGVVGKLLSVTSTTLGPRTTASAVIPLSNAVSAAPLSKHEFNGSGKMRMTSTTLGKTSVRYLHNDVVAPDFSAYKRDEKTAGDPSRRAFTYLFAGSATMLGAASVKNGLMDFLASWSASADVLALAKIEVDLTAIPEGKNLALKWRGKPLVIRHRTAAEIEEANSVDVPSLRDPETDADRASVPEYLVMIGVCTHLGCIPVGEAGDYGGWFCPCHGSHYDISGRIRKGPAPLNMEVPPYEFIEDGAKVVVG
ncbi:hypothetical protein SARC_05924 [Sphaeroforma arctica JP610]|uniref:Cytochrome b-c1 complex subunit Rieske, mitochondrial n=1 Tax=Sphaeroforma arctica JP610 TaxID=667725 RepID=A0A0L0G0P5_9EUKA|nr:hypothetical protein SARC_05924 [Sphaeroforma arctica JP610]KNC81778.1 hypothetical protein SARC_05924 [Sphaeroforma arctica JP610]|eukprot:XP_014155680.1 hypothetical protein SARC_05924 [Sphaeroforma arctica JP610]